MKWFNAYLKTLVLSAATLLVASLAGCGFTRYPEAGTPQNAAGTAPPATSANPPAPSAPGSPTSTPATFTQVNQQIFQPRCVGCHGSGASPDLTSFSSFAQNTTFVVPGNAAQSAIYTAVSTGRMPQGGTALTQAELSTLSSWIDNGAKND